MTEKEPFVVQKDEPRPLLYAHRKPVSFIFVAFVIIIGLQWLWQLQQVTEISTSPQDVDKGFRWEDVCVRLLVDWYTLLI